MRFTASARRHIVSVIVTITPTLLIINGPFMHGGTFVSSWRLSCYTHNLTHNAVESRRGSANGIAARLRIEVFLVPHTSVID